MTIRDENGWELVEYDYQTGRSVWMLYDGQATHYRTDYPVQEILDKNHEMGAAAAGGKWGDWAMTASVPLNVYYEQLAQADGEGDTKYLSKWLNDSDNAAFRVKEGRV